MIRRTHTAIRPLTALLLSASALAVAHPALAAEIVFADSAPLAEAALRGERVTQGAGVTQLRLDSGAVVSFVEGAEFQIRADGTLDLFSGTVTVTGADKADTVIHLTGPDGSNLGTGKLGGAGSSASFSLGKDRRGNVQATGRVLTGSAGIATGREEKRFTAGQAWEIGNGHARLAAAVPVQPVPRRAAVPAQQPPQVASIAEGGPAAAAENGVPVVLGDALAAAGASGDIVAAGQRVQAAATNPLLETFPSGDLAALVGHAAQLERLYGGKPFNQAQADIIRAYLGYLAQGGSGARFLTVYAGLMVQYLDLVRSGAAPSSFSGSGLADINAFISFRSRTDGFAALSAQNRVLVEAYLAFILGGGNADQFASRYTSLTAAYFTFVRGGGDPLAFAGATQATITAYLTFLNDSGLLVQLADADRALLQAYLANGGIAFAEQYRTALTSYYAYLASGKLPSGYAALDPATLRQYLETLQATGLFDSVLGAQATFYANYLAYLQAGGTIDGWQGLPANVFTGYAAALSAYYEFLASGGLPSAYSALTQAQISAYMAALQAAGANEAFLGQLAAFYGAYFTYLAQGGNPDLYTGLPSPPDYQAFASAVSAYIAFIEAGGVPSAYTGGDIALLQQYIKALIDSGQLASLLGAQAEFITAYYAYLAGGGSADGYAALPIYTSYASALEAYYAYLAAGGVPSGYTLLTQQQILAYLKALTDAGVLAALFSGQTLTFIQTYYVYLAGGGSADLYTGLPGNTGGGTGTGGTGYTGGFKAAAPKISYVTTVKLSSGSQLAGGLINLAADGYVLDASGGLVSYTSGPLADDRGTTSVTDIAGDADILLGRWTQGTTNTQLDYPLGEFQSLHYYVARELPANFTVPGSGTITYDLYAATKPTWIDGSGAPGTFTGKLALAFGTAPKVAMEAKITMPGTSAGAADYVIDFATTGGLADITQSRTTLNLYTNNAIGFLVLGDDHSGRCTIGSCYLAVNGTFAGSANKLATVYTAVTYAGNARNIIGAAAFGNASGGGAGTGGGGTLAAPTGAGLNIRAVGETFTSSGSRYAQGSFYTASGTVEAAADGQIHASTWGIDPASRVTAKNLEYGTSGGVIGWSRWADGTVNGTAGQTQSIPTNGGMSQVWGKPVSNLPTTGKVNYTMVGATSPILQSGAAAPGTLNSAAFAVDFGTVKAGFDAALSVNGVTYTIGSSGGAAAPSMTIAADGSFAEFSSPAHITGFLAGAGGSHAGVAYNIFGPAVSGVVAFAKSAP